MADNVGESLAKENNDFSSLSDDNVIPFTEPESFDNDNNVLDVDAFNSLFNVNNSFEESSIEEDNSIEPINVDNYFDKIDDVNLVDQEVVLDNGVSSDIEENNTAEDEQFIEKNVDNEDIDTPRLAIINDEETSNLFWGPVSDSKLEAGEFPSINIPITHDNLNNDDDHLGFPEINE